MIVNAFRAPSGGHNNSFTLKIRTGCLHLFSVNNQIYFYNLHLQTNKEIKSENNYLAFACTEVMLFKELNQNKMSFLSLQHK